ncbi:phage holin family protein [Enterobacter hormaechei]
MTWQLLLMDANAIVCLLIMVRLMFFRKEGKRHRLSVAVLAYLVILAAGFNAFNILLGHYVQVNGHHSHQADLRQRRRVCTD